MSVLIGLVGRPGVGKDTLADTWGERATSYAYGGRTIPGTGDFDASIAKLGFADPLRMVSAEVTGIPLATFLDPAQKDAMLTTPVWVDEYLEKLQLTLDGLIKPNAPVQPRGLVGYTPRDILKYVGTEYVRAVDPDYWVRLFHSMAGILLKHYDVVVANDVRFANEAACARSLGGVLVRVNRKGYSDAPAIHASDIESDAIREDMGVSNPGDLDLFKARAELPLALILEWWDHGKWKLPEGAPEGIEALGFKYDEAAAVTPAKYNSEVPDADA